MGLRINTLNSLGYRALRQEQSEQSRPLAPGSLTSPSSPLVKTESLAVTGNPQPRVRLSDTLQSQLSLNTLGLSREDSSEKSLRLNQDLGQGDARFLVRGETPVTEKFFNLEASIEVSPTKADPDLNQKNLELLRGAVAEKATEIVLNEPQITEEDLRSAIDDAFGAEISETLQVRIEDEGRGQSAVKTTQVEVSKLSLDEQDEIQAAISFAEENFKDVAEKVQVRGPDVERDFGQLTAALGYQRLADVNEVRKAFQSGAPETATEKLREKVSQDESLSEAQKQSALEALDRLQDKVESAKNSQNQSPFSDDLSVRFSSGRYAAAYSPSEVDEVASLTEDADFIAGGPPRVQGQ